MNTYTLHKENQSSTRNSPLLDTIQCIPRPSLSTPCHIHTILTLVPPIPSRFIRGATYA
ncbi:hypothetical protein BofuT4_uP157510.1 [Botrytis cinerea T4]|uniref:Uncharacterized protein n=1 Tax=Botryotinia fuckeliana (strain T4) TaxID=999810 RepID=G2YUQ7_BOTF4|nr:hypothetical protein BofuT4_uP157510.1 [Botrytis cinerea T4]